MGSGKTSLAKRLSTVLNMPLVDLDHYITKQIGIGVEEIFSSKGESEFRKLESVYLNELLNRESPHLIALGGGAICNDQNLKIIKEKSFSVYLKFEPAVLKSRILNSKTVRPIVKKVPESELETFIENHLKAREPYYNQADFVLDNVMDIPKRCSLIEKAYEDYLK